MLTPSMSQSLLNIKVNTGMKKVHTGGEDRQKFQKRGRKFFDGKGGAE